MHIEIHQKSYIWISLAQGEIKLYGPNMYIILETDKNMNFKLCAQFVNERHNRIVHRVCKEVCVLKSNKLD